MALVGVVGALAVAEAALRIRGFQYQPFPAVQFGWPEPQVILDDFRPDPDLLWVNRDYVERAGFQPVSPTPEREIAGTDGTTFIMAASPVGRPVRVRFRLNPEGPGFLRARVRLDDGGERMLDAGEVHLVGRTSAG